LRHPGVFRLANLYSLAINDPIPTEISDSPNKYRKEETALLKGRRMSFYPIIP
jgi:hypothetical protein